MNEDKMAAIMHMEGAEAIGEGIPFCFPSDGDIGSGLTDHGVNLVKRRNELRILIDLSHLNEAGFWDVAKFSNAPLVATHSNAYETCHSSRNFTDKQFDAIVDSDGMVGVNFSDPFLRPDGQKNPIVDLELIVRQFDYLIDKLGEDRVGFGSDYDGAMVPEKISSVTDLPILLQAMHSNGIGEEIMAKLCHKNWFRVLDKSWGQ